MGTYAPHKHEDDRSNVHKYCGTMTSSVSYSTVSGRLGPTHLEAWMGWWADFSSYTGTIHRSTTNTLRNSDLFAVIEPLLMTMHPCWSCQPTMMTGTVCANGT